MSSITLLLVFRRIYLCVCVCMWYGLCVCVNVYVYVYVGCTYVDARSKFFILMWKTFLIQPELPSFQGQGFFFFMLS